MNWKSVRVLFLHETRMLLRDRRTVVLAVVIPLVTMPLILYAMTALEQRRRSSLEEVTYRYSVVGAEAEAARVLIRRFRESSAASEARAPTADETSPFKFEEVQVDDPVESLRTRSLHFYLEALSGDEADDLAAKQAAEEETKKKEDPGPRKDSEEKTERVLREETRQAGVPTIRVVFYADRDISRNGGRQMREYLRRAIRSERDHALEAAGLALDPAEIFAVEESSVASAAQATGSVIGRFLTLFVFMLVLSGGSIVALDIIAGEKERGSLETLLSTAARRSEIVAAKQLTILTVALLTIVIQVANLVAYVKFRVIPVPEDWVIEISPLALLTLTCLLIPVAAFISAVLLMLSAYAKSYKEAQLYFFPVYLAGMVPAAAAALP
ncbi:MAG: ABC transporter permease, partial [Acidobacteria bacterium]|nr:ABC transporter permease [Acidobacteriota bacterium]